MPPEASGPVLMVRKPTLMGPLCASAAGSFSVCDATPAASAPLMTVRRFMPILFLPVTTLFQLPKVQVADCAGAGGARQVTLRCLRQGLRRIGAGHQRPGDQM